VTPYVIAFIPLFLTAFLMFFGWALCRAASDADDALGYDDIEGPAPSYGEHLAARGSVAPYTLVLDALEVRENGLIGLAEEATSKLDAAVLWEEAQRVNVARAVVTEMRDTLVATS
jgi:hypothetical protein